MTGGQDSVMFTWSDWGLDSAHVFGDVWGDDTKALWTYTQLGFSVKLAKTSFVSPISRRHVDVPRRGRRLPGRTPSPLLKYGTAPASAKDLVREAPVFSPPSISTVG